MLVAGEVAWIIALFVISAFGGIAAWCFFVWAIKDKQFEDTEDVAARMLKLDEVTVVESEPTTKDKEGARA